MAVLLHAVEALPGAGRYAVTFRRPDGLDQTAVVHVGEGGLDVAAASLPEGWHRDSTPFVAMAAVVSALHDARSIVPPAAELTDIDGGWDVSLGNVVLSDGVPTCSAHGAMAHGDEDVYECAVCAARARYAGAS
jgi:hypothetical protein